MHYVTYACILMTPLATCTLAGAALLAREADARAQVAETADAADAGV